MPDREYIAPLFYIYFNNVTLWRYRIVLGWRMPWYTKAIRFVEKSLKKAIRKCKKQ